MKLTRQRRNTQKCVEDMLPRVDELLTLEWISEEIGHGLFAKKDIDAGDMIIEYEGNFMDADIIDTDMQDDTYTFEFQYRGKTYLIDATEVDALGKFINDDHRHPNCRAKVFQKKTGKPAIVFVANRKIKEDEELRYNYGKGPYPWRKKNKIQLESCDNSKDSDEVKDADMVQDADDGIADSDYIPGTSNESEDEMEDTVKEFPMLNSDEVKDADMVQDADDGIADSDYIPGTSNESEDEMEDTVKEFPMLNSDEVKYADMVQDADDGIEDSDYIPGTSNESEDEMEDTVKEFPMLNSDEVKDADMVQDADDGIEDSDYIPGTSNESEDEMEDTVKEFPMLNSDEVKDADMVQDADDGIEDSDYIPGTSNESEDEMEDTVKEFPMLNSDEVKDADMVQDADDGIEDSDYIPGTSNESEDEMEDTVKEFPMLNSDEVKDADMVQDADDGIEDSDYIPGTSNESEDEMEDTVKEFPMLNSDEVKDADMVQDADDGIEDSDYIPGTSNESEDKVEDTVKEFPMLIKISSTRNHNGKRVWDKRNSCYYCSNLETNIGRHLKRRHNNENMVAKALSFRKHSKERLKELEKIRHLGNFYHNSKVLVLNEGTVLVVKRPPKEASVSAEDYLPCVFCKGYFVATELWRHYKECKFKDGDDDELEHLQNGGLRASRMLKASISQGGIEHKYGELFGTMKLDLVRIVCKTDQIISTLGKNLLASKGVDQLCYIRAKMREIARLLIKVREKGDQMENLSVNDMLRPQMFDLVIESIHSICNYLSRKGDQSPKYEIPSLALKMGHSLRKCAYLKQGICIRSNNKGGEEEAESFLKLMDMEFTLKVSSIALSTLHTNRQRKVQTLPITEDIVKFHLHVKSRVNSLYEELDHAGDGLYAAVYQSLAKATASRIITFNKKRSGEVGRILITDFTERGQVRTEGCREVFQMLSKAEQKLSERLEMMKIKGKRGRLVAVILTLDMTKALESLVDEGNRKRAGISPSNKYAFPLSRGSTHNVRGCDALAETVKGAQLQHPDTFKSTALRKYIATISQILNMEDNELDWLASHLGHDVKVHRSFYRLQEQHVELAKVAKLLYAVDNGKAHLYAGKSLNEVQIEGIDDVESNDLSEDDGETENSDIDEEGTVGVESIDESVYDGTAEGDGADVNERDEQPSEMKEKLKKQPGKKGKQCIHRKWTNMEKTLVMQEFDTAIKCGTIAGVGKKQIEEKILKAGKILNDRTWVQVKSCLKNIIDKKKKNSIKLEMRKHQFRSGTNKLDMK